MKNILKKYRYLLLRRITQISVLLLYFGANAWGWNILMGNLSSSILFQTIPISDPFAILQMLSAGALLAIDVIIGGLLVTIFYMLIGGRAFCSWVCPINMVTDLANWLRRKLELKRVQKKQPSSRNIRYWMLGMSLVISALLGVAAFEFISPISMMHRGIVFGLGFGWAAIFAIFLFDLFVLKNGWCGHVCPLGGFYSLIGRFSLIRVKYDKDRCTECMECKVVCPEPEVLHMVTKESASVVKGECTNCARCIEVCNDEALEFSIKKFIQKGK